MRTLLIIVVLFLIGATTSNAQTYEVKDNQLVQVKDTTSTKKERPNDISREGLQKTGWTVTKKGVEYPVYKGKRSGYFIIRRSARSGKEYKQYIKVQ